MPFGFLTEEGPERWFANVYNAREMPTKSYAARTLRNVQDSDGTLWFGTTDTPGAKTTLAWIPMPPFRPNNWVIIIKI
jgi:Circularly permutated YpsA SLOG family